MKDQWSISENNKQLAKMEEGLQREKQKYEKDVEYKTNCCIQCIPYLRLILLLEVTLFLGWGCYMIMQIYFPKEIKSETTNITFERYPSVIELLPEVQKSHPATEMPAILVKPEIIIDKIQNFLEDIKFTKDQHLKQNKAIVINVPYETHTDARNSNVRSNNLVETNPINKLLGILSSRNLMRDKKESSIPQKIISVEYIDKNINIGKNKNSSRYTQFLEKLRNIGKTKVPSDLIKFENRNYLIEDVNLLTSESQENHASDVSSEFENLELDIITILNPENFVNLANTLQNPKQEFSSLTKDVMSNDLKNSLLENTDKQVNAYLESDFVKCPPYESHESSDMLMKNFVKSISVSQPVTQEILEQVENGSSDNIDEKNTDKYGINDSTKSMSVSAFGNQDYSDTSIVTVGNIENQYLSENLAQIKKDEKYESTENIKNSDKLWLLQPMVQDDVESSTSNVEEFQWINAPPSLIELELGEGRKSNKIPNSLSWDTTKNMDIEDVVPGSRCNIIIKTGILEVKCPAIKFDEEWNFTSKSPLSDVPEVTNFEDIFDDYLRAECSRNANNEFEVENNSDESSDKKVTKLRDRKSQMINAFKLQESTSSSKIPNDVSLFDTEFIDSLNSEKTIPDYANYDSFYDLNEEKVKQVEAVSPSISEFSSSTTNSNKEEHLFFDIYDARHQEKLKINKGQDLVDVTETSVEDLKYLNALKEKLTSFFKNKMLNIMTQYLSKSSAENNYRNNICDILRYTRSMFQHPWREQYVALRKLLKYIQNSDYLNNTDDFHRKKRMIDDLTWQQDQVSNTLEEDDKEIDLLKNLKQMYLKMEILALTIDRLHERYLHYNKLDDDYVSSELPIETEEHELYA